MATEGLKKAVVWLAPEQAGLVREVARIAGLEIVAAGSPARGHSQAVASELGARALDDLRAAVAQADAELFWILAPGTFGTGQGPEDAAAIGAASSRGVKITTLEPIPGAALDLVAGGWASPGVVPRPVDAVRFCPLARLSKSFREAADLLETFGPVRTLAVEAWCASRHGSLGARLFSALELVHSLMGEPETIDAAYVGPGFARGVHAVPGESLRDLRGDMTANLRFADGRAACIVASDQGGRWSRGATFLGAGGRIRVTDAGLEWIGPDGAVVEQGALREDEAMGGAGEVAAAASAARADGAKKGTGRRSSSKAKGGAGAASRTRSTASESPALPFTPTVDAGVAAIADALARLLDPGSQDPGPTDYAAVLSMGQAALLSARTGQGESPATIRRMAGAE